MLTNSSRGEPRSPSGRRGFSLHGAGFTLIELLVVVAIIALLIAILLPSLSKARAQARSTICATRLAQLTRAQLMYADDFDETPPFVGVGYSNAANDSSLTERRYRHLSSDDSRNTEEYFARHESWLFPGWYYVDEGVWTHPHWPDLPGGGPTPREGTLYPYTRFENLYRCPEFERIPIGTAGRNGSAKTQNTFNYTRSILGRKLLSNVEGIDDPAAEEADEPLWPGRIMKLSTIYAPAAMIMMLDEQWDFHCAGNYGDGGTLGYDWMWMAAESIHGLTGDMVGSYHGSMGRVLNDQDWDMLLSNKMGSLGYYDGHVALVRDPWAWRTVGTDYNILSLITQLAGDMENGQKVLSLLLESIYAQRGLPFGQQQIIDMLMSKL